jgi:5-methylcytosine-specific restriction protein B
MVDAEVMRFFYPLGRSTRGAPRREIAPGEDAKYWDDCLREGYICVGWDKVGDLREFPSRRLFRAKFESEYAETTTTTNQPSARRPTRSGR